MKTLNNEIIVYRNETFTMSKLIRNRDNSPFIVSNRINNPYWLLSVASTRYSQLNRYIENWWLDLTSYPRFLTTRPIDLLSFKTDAAGATAKYPSGFADITSLTLVDGVYYVAYGYIDGVLTYYEPSDAVFVYEGEYKYWSTVQVGGQDTGWLTYECKIIKAFSQETTGKWIEQNYTYSISLVGGTTTLIYLQNLCTANSIPYIAADTKYDLYAKVLAADLSKELPNNFSIEAPIATFDIVVPVLVPTKMTVNSNLQGGM